MSAAQQSEPKGLRPLRWIFAIGAIGGLVAATLIPPGEVLAALGIVEVPPDAAGSATPDIELPRPAKFGGRLHPMLLHLPIGCLWALIALEASRLLRRNRAALDGACRIVLWVTVLTAIPTILAGNLLAAEGDWSEDILTLHQRLGLGTGVACIVLLAGRPQFPGWLYGLLLVGTAGLLTGAGHYGATMTHGARYIEQHAPWTEPAAERVRPKRTDPGADPAKNTTGGSVGAATADIAATAVAPDLFADAVFPILQARCVSCHGEEKQKGDLRLDSFAAIANGIEGDPILAAGDTEGSVFIEVLQLPLDDDYRMPPDGKPQLTAEQIEILTWWVEAGAKETMPLADAANWSGTTPARRAALDVVLKDIGSGAIAPAIGGDEAGGDEGAGDEPPTEPTPGQPVGKDKKVGQGFTPARVDVPAESENGANTPAQAALAAAKAPASAVADAEAAANEFEAHIQPLLAQHCFECHGEDKQKGSMRFDQLDPAMVAVADAEGWHAALDMIQGGEMPPDDAPQFADADRRRVVAWLTTSLKAAAEARRGELHTVLRRLNKRQYTHTLQDLLGIGVDFGQVLPNDGTSEMGFSNSGEVLQASPLHLDYYQQVARQAVAEAIRPGPRPEPARYRIAFGKGVGRGKVAAETGGYQSVILPRRDFAIDILNGAGEAIQPSDDEERERLDDIRRRISIGLRGSAQDRFHSVDEGLLLYSALPHREVVPAAWQGPSPNVKMEMQRVFPRRGDFVLRVTASRGYLPATRQQMLIAMEEPTPFASLQADRTVIAPANSMVFTADKSDERKNMRPVESGVLRPADVPKAASARFRIKIPADGFYQVDLVHPAVASADAMASARLTMAGRTLDMRPEVTPGAPPAAAAPTGVEPTAEAPDNGAAMTVSTLGAAVLRGGNQVLKVGGAFFVGFSHVVVTPLAADHPLVARLTAETAGRMAALADKVPALRAYVGTRTDDGMDYATFDAPQEVHAPLGKAEVYTFRGRLENLPIPEPESGDTEILSGFMLLGVWNDHLVKHAKETGPPLLIEAMEFEAPYFEQWPPASHRAIFAVADGIDGETEKAAAILEPFMSRAFRRPVEERELQRYLAFWRDVRLDFDTFEESISETVVAVLCSPRFLFLAEPGGDETDPPSHHGALASRLSYFLWNSPPDAPLADAAQRGVLRDDVLTHVDRMLDDERAWRFVRAFGREWLRLDRLEGVTVNPRVFPAFTRFVKHDMAEETYHFLHRVLREDLSLFELVDSDVAMLNQNLAEFYGIAGVQGPEFRPVPVPRERGGLLSQGAFLTGHSDGTWPHTVKRAVWVAEKILGNPPPAPPPNVPDLDPDTPGFENLTLKQQLEAHRDNPSCVDCHLGIDPYGVVFERYNAVGLLEDERRGVPIDSSSTLPDGSALDGVTELKGWLQSQKRDAFAASVIKHLYAYALGRDLSFADQQDLDAILHEVAVGGYRMRTVVRSIVTSPAFLGSN